ncbi:hypothetical protein ACNQVK_00925 [Mycobacterium sp. 134]|uniref:hypothetical protein n=1 Tax=Mycobacterium sp. 134 TaxID=3400425 RepID=UPI003AAC2B50
MAVWTIEAWLGAVGMDSDACRDLLHKALNPASPEREALELPEPGSDDAQVVMVLLRKGQVPTRLAVGAHTAHRRPYVPRPVWSDEQIDRFGRVASTWVDEFWQSHTTGPTWAEMSDSAAVEQARKELELPRRGRDFEAAMTCARRRGWLAWDMGRTRSLCAGPAFFASRYQPPGPVGRRVATAVRRFRLANDGRRPRWEDLVADIRDSAGNTIFRDVDDARAQSAWLEAERWIKVKGEEITAGAKAKRWAQRKKTGKGQQGDSGVAAAPADSPGPDRVGDQSGSSVAAGTSK